MTVTEVALGDVTSAPETWAPEAAANGLTFDYVDIASVDAREKLIRGASKLLVAEAPSRARQILQSGDVLVSTVRPNLNAVAVVQAELGGAIASTGFAVLRPDVTKVDTRYLFHWVRSPQFVHALVSRATGASYPAVSQNVVRESRFPLLPLPEQRRIAAMLDTADRIRRKHRERLARLDELLRSVFLEMFGDPVRNEKGWEVGTLGELLRVKSGNFLPANQMDSGGSFLVYGGNGPSGVHSKYMFEAPVIAIGRVGVYCGAVHLTPAKSWVTDNALYVAEHDDRLQTAYLEWALRMLNLNRVASQAAQPLISAGRIAFIALPVPPLDLQGKFASIIEMHARLHEHVEKALAVAGDLQESLAQRAFGGAK